MSKLSTKTTEWLKQAEQKYISDMPEITDENRARVKYMQDGLKAVQEELALRLVDQKKSQEQAAFVPPNIDLPTVANMQEWAKKESPIEKEERLWTKQMMEGEKTKSEKWEEIRVALPAMARAYDETIKTIKAPTIDREPEYINIELTDQKGAKYIRTYNRAQVKALCRKYFSNVHNAWVGGNRKLTNGFENLLVYFLGWAEFDGKTPGLQDVLQDYFRYKKASEKSEDSEAFKVAKELYDKIILVTSEESQNEA
jgi:hypothetical protein